MPDGAEGAGFGAGLGTPSADADSRLLEGPAEGANVTLLADALLLDLDLPPLNLESSFCAADDDLISAWRRSGV